MFYINDTIEAMSAEELSSVIASLPSWRKEIAMKFKYESGRRESAMSFVLLQNGLHDDFGIDDAFDFDYNEHGKPELCFHGDNVNDDNTLGIHFNISHCKHAVACAIDKVPVGIDVEATGRYKPQLANYVMSDSEIKDIESSDDKDLCFTRLWTMKEALVKLIGTGITDNMKTLLQDYEGKVDFTIVERREKGYVCTVAVRL